MQAHFQQAFDKVDLPLAQIQLLMFIAQYGPVNSKDLAAKMHLTPGAITQTVECLDRMGLVDRKPDEHDRRVNYLTLSRHGKRKVDKLHKAHERLFAEALTTLSDAELQTYLGLQRKMLAHWEAQSNANKQTGKDTK